MSQDDDDWVGTPPEGRHSRDRAKPEFWQQYGWVLGISGGILLIGIIVVLIAAT
jgi:hypothetical protein